MATFPAIQPLHPAPKRSSVNGGLLLGDGYERSIRFGLNNVRPEWQLVWEVTAANTSTIEAFLQARANAGESFDWQPPDSAIALRWRCEEWSVEQTAFNWFRLSATFKRVFEFTTAFAVTPVSIGCVDDDLCEVDLQTILSILAPPAGLLLGQTLTAITDLPFTGAAYQWLRNDVPIPGATSVTYVLTNADLGAEINVTATRQGLTLIAQPVYPPFNPYLYSRYRWNGVVRKQLSPIGGCDPVLQVTQIITNWKFSISGGNQTYGYVWFEGDPAIYGAGLVCTGSGAPWQGNRTLRFTGTGPLLGLNSQIIGYIGANYDGFGAGGLQIFGAAVGSYPCNPILAQTEGQWEFTNAASPNGSTIPSAVWVGADPCV